MNKTRQSRLQTNNTRGSRDR